MLITLLEQVPKAQLLVVHASLGDVEWPGALELARKQAHEAGVAFHVARARKTLFDMVEHRHRTRPDVPSWSSSKTRQCTSDLKRDPIMRDVRRYAREQGFSVVVNCLGLRAAESHGRAKRPTLSRNARGCAAGREWFEWLPIHAMSTADVFELIVRAGQRPHPAYAAGNERLSCMFCIMGSQADLRRGASANPALFQRYLEMEARTGYTMHMSRKPLRDLVGSGGEDEATAKSARAGRHGTAGASELVADDGRTGPG